LDEVVYAGGRNLKGDKKMLQRLKKIWDWLHDDNYPQPDSIPLPPPTEADLLRAGVKKGEPNEYGGQTVVDLDENGTPTRYRAYDDQYRLKEKGRCDNNTRPDNLPSPTADI
jgi:hypothetical protein